WNGSAGADAGWLDEVSYKPRSAPLEKPALRLEISETGLEIVVAPDAEGGVLNLYRAPTLEALTESPDLMLSVNVPVYEELRIPVDPTGDREFFRGVREHGETYDFVWPDFPGSSEA